MKLKLPHKTYDLDMNLNITDRLVVINELLKEKIEFHDETMTVEEYFRYTWTNPKANSKTCMDIIGYYLTKEEKDLEILSKGKQNEMLKGSKRHTTFSGMGYDNQVAVGLIDVDEY